MSQNGEIHFRKRIWLDSFLATLLVFLFIGIIKVSFHRNLSVFDVVVNSINDVEFTDLVFSKEQKENIQAEKLVSDSIVLVNISYMSRGMIAGLIDCVSVAKPRVIGLDVTFEGVKDTLTDRLLQISLKNAENLVSAVRFPQDREKMNVGSMYSGSVISGKNRGFANFAIADTMAVVRRVRFFEPVIGEENVFPSFTAKIAELANPKAFAELKKKNKSKEMVINYSGTLKNFHTYQGYEIIDSSFDKIKMLRNKIVLIGFLGFEKNHPPVLEDRYFTPMNNRITGRSHPDTYGLVIHANILHMILSGKYVRQLPAVLNVSMAFVVCFLHMALFIYFFVRSHHWYHLRVKIIQFIGTVFLIFLFIVFFDWFNLKIDSTLYLASVVLSVDILYFYGSLIRWLHRRTGVNTYITQFH